MDLNLDIVFRAVRDNPFFLATFTASGMSSKIENAILIDEEEVKENSPPPSTSVTEQPNDSSSYWEYIFSERE